MGGNKAPKKHSLSRSALELHIRGVSLWVSVKVIVRDVFYDLEAVAERQVIEYALQEKGPMLC